MQLLATQLQHLLVDVPFTAFGFIGATFMGAVGGAVSGGIGQVAGDIMQFGEKIVFQMFANGISQSLLSGVSGGDMLQSFVSGALSSIVSSAWAGSDKVGEWKGVGGNFARKDIGILVFGTAAGAGGAALTKGNIWQGAAIGLVVSGLNHVAHQMDSFDGGDDANVYVEKDGVGHAYVEVDGTVYSYGRYNGSYSPASGSLGPLGDGVLLKLDGQTATNFISERTSNYPTEKFTVQVNASKVKSYYNKLYNKGTPLQGKTGYNAYGRVIGTYNLVGPGGNNCVTLTYKALNYGGAKIRPAQTPAGMLYDFRQINYINQGINPSQSLWGRK